MWEDLEVLEGSPVKKWHDIIFHANENLAQKELERLLELLAVYELLIQQEDLEEKADKMLQSLRFDTQMQEKVKRQKENLAIGSMAKVLSENE